MPERISRIDAARRRAAEAKGRLVWGALAAFVTALGLTYVSHPGSSRADDGSGSGAGSDATAGEVQSDDDFSFGSSSIAPTAAAPQVGTHVS